MERQTGQTTRLIDEYIQELFLKGEAVLQDHFNSLESNQHLFHRFKNRLLNEHPGIFNKCTIRGNSPVIITYPEFKYKIDKIKKTNNG